MERAEQRVVFSKKYDEKFVGIVARYQKRHGLPTFKAAIIALTNKGLGGL